MGLWSTQTKVEGIMLRAAWHWGRDSSVIKDPVGEIGSVDNDLMFFALCRRAPFGDLGRHT